MKNELRFGISPREIPITVTQGSVAVKVKLCVVHIHCMCVCVCVLGGREGSERERKKEST